jgi:hypothetical protein
MDSDFKTPSSEPVGNDETNETRVPVMNDSPSASEGPTNDVNDSAGTDSFERDSPSVSDQYDHPTSEEPESPKSSEFNEPIGSVTPAAVVPPVKIQGAHKFVYGYVGLVILIALIAGVYVWQHNKVTSLETRLAASSSELSSQQQRVYTLESQLSKAQSEIASSATPTLGLSVVKAARYTPSGTNTAKNSGVAVDVTITNSTSKAVSLVTSDFKLKDAQGNEYVATNFPAQATDSSLPAGYTLLIDQSLAAGATVSGTLEFGVPTTTLTSFTLVYNSQTLPVTVTSN